MNAYLYAQPEGLNFTMVVVNLDRIAPSCHNGMIYIYSAMSLVYREKKENNANLVPTDFPPLKF